MAEIAKITPAAEAPAHKARPEKPDEEKYKSDLSVAEKELAAAQEQLTAVREKVALAGPPNKDSPTARKRQELQAQLVDIRKTQQGFKAERNHQQEKIVSLDHSLKAKIAEQKNARGRVSFKSIEEVDRQIKRLEEQVDTGTMKLVDEKKALAEITNLRKQRKQFAGFDESQKEIDGIKAKISELKKNKESPEETKVREQYAAIQKELDDIKAEHDEAYKNLSSLRDERTRLQNIHHEKLIAVRALKDNYFKAKREYKEYEDSVWKARKERQRAEREAFEKEKRRKVAEKKMEDARSPAYTDEILTAEGLIRYFDPSSAQSNTASGPGKFAAQAQRTVDDSGMKGMRLVKKDEQEDNYFVGGGGKKGKKGKKGGNHASSTAADAGRFNLSIGVIEELARVGVEPPMNQSDVVSVVEDLKLKVDTWKKNQKSKTEENIQKAQNEIDRLEKDALEAPVMSPPTKADKGRSLNHGKKAEVANEGVNGSVSADAELAQEKDADIDVAEEMKQASLEEKAE